MKEITATEIKNNLGDVMAKAQSSPIRITRRGRREFVFTTERDYNELMHIKRAALVADLNVGIDQLKSGQICTLSISEIIAQAKREHTKEVKNGER